MDWKKVRSWLILLLLAVDLFLAGNLGVQEYRARSTHFRAVQDALSVAEAQGIRLPKEDVLSLPETMTSYFGLRSAEMENRAAQALLGEGAEEETPGGGVIRYHSEKGSVSFRRGGALELDTPWNGDTGSGRVCADALEAVGFPMEQVQISENGTHAELMQLQEKLPVFNSRLTCTLAPHRLQVRGRWILDGELSAGGGSLHRAQMVLSLCSLLRDRGAEEVFSIRAGYYLLSEDALSLRLEPVWSAETDQGELILSCVSGRQLSY